MTKQEILERFKDIDFMYNDSSRLDTLSRMIDELFQSKPQIVRCKDCKYWNHLINNRGYCSNFAQCYDGELFTDDDWFCADGEQREGAE